MESTFMTEEDTFNTLRRSPFEVLYKDVILSSSLREFSDVLTKHKWTADEYYVERHRRSKQLAWKAALRFVL
jgi:hypothetical protein